MYFGVEAGDFSVRAINGVGRISADSLSLRAVPPAGGSAKSMAIDSRLAVGLGAISLYLLW